MEKNGIAIYAHERLEDLGNGLFIIQNPKAFCFGIDAVLLSWFASPKIKRKSKTLEVGTGTGILPLLISKKSPVEHITAYEIQERMAEMAEKSVRLNGLESRIEIVEGDILESAVPSSSLDVILSNPPYMKENGGFQNPDDSLRIARHEITLTLESLLAFSGRMLKEKGRLFMVHKAERLGEIAVLGEKNHLALKRLCMVHPELEKPANLVLVELVKGGKPYLKVEPPVIVYDGEDYTQKIHTIYGTDGPSRKVLKEAE